ncbi:FAD-dependent oxidoreductase [Paraburkholderia sp. LEh10]|uniref:FAD-dependent oxidoreductase n=1 Tax=Paraburkholderia sp. LEh10 TaxID=2821353 RepID=UPI001AE652BD|nr:FAD-dependent oxidoreductase [Paraburkholderia sp. LEh10]MBP0593264.1 FAD-dependent oxidoreductase [Paraburkholderia sp. LEh10]
MALPLRIAIVGAGPAAMYAVGHLLDSDEIEPDIDIFERLPNPWGLVRTGVAPDHPEKKRIVDRLFDFYFRDSRVRFFGNVEIGVHLGHTELAQWYDAVIYAVGAGSDTRMRIPGEELPGCWAAREFVGFYNGHPDHRHLEFDLSCERALVIGNGNVALDIARILTMPVAELERTDIADHALDALRRSAVREVVVLGRRGILQAAFHNPELEELTHLDGVDVIIEGQDLPGEDDILDERSSWEVRRKVAMLKWMSGRRSHRENKRIVLRFLASPVELNGNRKVEEVVIGHNRIERDEQGIPTATPTDERSVLHAGLVLRAIGYRGMPFPGLPFDEHRGVIRNVAGRVVDVHGPVLGAYVTGWIKRGCRGVIGSNKKCAHETVEALIDDARKNRLRHAKLSKDTVATLIKRKHPDVVSRADWLAIDRSEKDAGRVTARPRIKKTDIPSMLACARDHALISKSI